MTELYIVQNMRDAATDARMSINVGDLTQTSMCKVWTINFLNMEITKGRLIGVDKNGAHYVLLDDEEVRAAEDAVWAIPESNIYYDKHSAEKGLFTARLKYESD